MANDHEWRDLMWADMADLGTLLHDLPDEDFDKDSLCEGWKVRDVVGHMMLGHTTPMGQMLKVLATYKFNVTKGSFEQSQEFVRDMSPDEIRATWDGVVKDQTRRGIAKVIRANEAFVDHAVHQQDIRRPLGRARDIPQDRLLAALDGAISVSSPMFSPKKNAKGLRLQATDVDWAHGDGPEVSGPGEAILMATAGRQAALDDLSGDGVAVLAGRIGG